MAKDNVVKITELQEKKAGKDRRNAQRVLLGNLFGAFAVIDRKGLLKLQLVDLSETGLRFELEEKCGRFRKGERLAFRLYFSQFEYLPLTIKVVHTQNEQEENVSVVQYGCQFEADERVQECVRYLLEFVKRYVELAKDDTGDRQYLPFR